MPPLLKNTLLEDFIALIFPNTCIACGNSLYKGEEQLCTNCRFELPVTQFHLDTENVLKIKFAGRIPLKYSLAYLIFRKDSKVQKILHELKYRNNQEIGEFLGHWYGDILVNHQIHQDFDLILPIPLHISKFKKRGYNQSDCFAKGLSEAMDVEWSSEVLLRNRATDTQTKKKRMERFENVDRIFEIKDTEKIKSKRILLVDDIVTTGSTLESCAKCLLDAGCLEVSIAAIAMASD